MRRKLIIELALLIIILFLVLIVSFIIRPINVKEVKYFLEDKTIWAEVTIYGNKKDLKCQSEIEIVGIKDKKCILKVPAEKSKLQISNAYRNITYKLKPNINKIVDFTLSENKIYLAIDETKEITFSVSSIGNPEKDIKLISQNENVVQTQNNVIIGYGSGNTKVEAKVGDITKSIDVVVTDLITKPIWKGQDKSLIPCHAYTEEESRLLDEMLEYQINTAGYETRAGAVAAARFLTLELPYRIPYFYENGRVNNTGVHFVEAEGRYYRKGLYLRDSIMETIQHTWTGPAIWGCPLRNLENEPKYGYYPGYLMPNGLDCSGFVSWVLLQAGFDVGDIGAGESEGYQLTDTGEFVRLTSDLIDSGKIKTGDLFNYWGHISILVGIDDDYYYIAESLPGKNFDGATVRQYSKKTVMRTFPYAVLMDNYYKEDGNYTEYWE